jgi:hypothetical protein
MGLVWQPTIKALASQVSYDRTGKLNYWVDPLIPTLISNLSAAGNNYDSSANNGANSQSPYAQAWQAWWTPFVQTWTQLDQLSQYAYSVGGSSITSQISAAFGLNTVASAIVWQPSTSYALSVLVSPNTAPTGFYYRVTGSGTSANPSPVWPTILGQTATDGGGVTFQCLTPILGGLQNGKPPALPPDETLQSQFATTARAAAAQLVVGASGPTAASMVANITNEQSNFLTALAAKPNPALFGVPNADTTSISLYNALNAALQQAQSYCTARNIPIGSS